MRDPHPIVISALEQLDPHRDLRRARDMAAYMRTTQPFLGVGEPDRRPIYRALATEFAPASLTDLRTEVLALWTAGRKGDGFVPFPPAERQFHPRPGSTLLPPPEVGPRELQYCAIAHLERGLRPLTPAMLPLVRRLIIAGGWWDMVDWLSMRLLSPIHLANKDRVRPVVLSWLKDPNIWVRRAAMLSQLSHKSATDERMLFDSALTLASEKEFFIRKSIGWALRQHARTAPTSVRSFVKKHIAKFSTLTVREAAKHLDL
ncbi:MAG: DNA alkylation repair protein [Phycisphaerales bacterium]